MSVTLWMCIYFVHLQPMPQAAATTAPFHYEFFLLSHPLCPSVSLSVTFCVSAIHTPGSSSSTPPGPSAAAAVYDVLAGQRGVGLSVCKSVCVCVCVWERRYRQVVFIISFFFFPRRIRRETPTVHNNIQQQYETFVNNTSSTLALSRRRSNMWWVRSTCCARK